MTWNSAAGLGGRARGRAICAGIHATYALLIAAAAVYTFFLSSSARHSNDANTRAGAHDLFIGGWMMAGVALVLVGAALLLWHGVRWAWWFSLVVNLAIVLVIALDMLSGDHDPDNWIAIALFAAPLTSLAISRVRPPRQCEAQ